MVTKIEEGMRMGMKESYTKSNDYRYFDFESFSPGYLCRIDDMASFTSAPNKKKVIIQFRRNIRIFNFLFPILKIRM
jgi:hypothetical protein